MRNLSALSALLMLLALCASVAMHGQDLSIEGTITSERGSSITGVSVWIKGDGVGTISNARGAYKLSGLDKGELTVVFSSLGYETFESNFLLESDITLDVELVEQISSIPEVAVISGGVDGIRDLPGSAQYLSPRELDKFSYTDINRTLRSVPGINLQEEDGFGLRANIGLRGTGVERSSKITVMEDGVLMAPAPYSAPAAYYFPTIGRMQGVEILKGSSQIKYGPYTTGGAINLVSTQIPSMLSGKVDLIASSFGGRNLHAHVGNSQGRIGYLVETFQFGSDGFKQIDGGFDAGFIKQDYLAKVSFSNLPSARTPQTVLLKFGYTEEASHETYLGLSEEDFDLNPTRRYAGSQEDRMDTEQHQMSINHSAQFGKWNLSTTIYRTDFSRNWYKLDKFVDSTGTKHSISEVLEQPEDHVEAFSVIGGEDSTEGALLQVKANNRSYYAQGIQSELSRGFDFADLDMEITVGARYHEDQIDRFQWVDGYSMVNGTMNLVDAGVAGTESNRVGDAAAFASYLQSQFNYRRWTFTPGLRYENMCLSRDDFGKNDPDRTGTELSSRNNQAEVVIPGVGVDFVIDEFSSVFGGVHRGFSPPSSKEETDPEKSINYELGFRYAKKGLTGQVVVFFNDYSNLLGSDLAAAGGGGSGDLFNGGEVETMGLELEVKYDLLASNERGIGFPVSLVYTYTDAKFLNDFESAFEGWGTVAAGDKFPYLANNQMTASVGFTHPRFSVNVGARYMDQMRTRPGQGDIEESHSTDDYFVVDASAQFVIHPGISLFSSITNVSDETYVVARRPAGLRPGMPRAFSVGLKARF